MRKYLLLLVVFMTTSLSAQTLIVWQKNGEKTYFSLNENPKTTFSDSEMVISTHMLTIKYPLSNILRYTFSPSSTGIENIADAHGASISQEGSTLSIANIKKGSEVSLYSIDGKIINKQVAHKEGTMKISLASHPSGVYIVKHNDVSYKITKP